MTAASGGVRVEGLTIAIGGRRLVEDVSFAVAPGECVALVGESGAGKSLTARALLGLLPEGSAAEAATLEIDGVEMRRAREDAWRAVRGARVALVAQDALVALDPLRRIGAEVAEPLEIHTALDRESRRERVHELLASVAMPEPARRARQRPHELSGGLRQRALIASALAVDPAILVADEPTTALDATVQAHVLDLLRRIADAGTAVVFVNHDMAAVRRLADRVIVMQDGRVVETGPTAQVMAAPAHPHTRALVAASSHEPKPEAAPGTVLLRVDGASRTYDRPAVADATFELGEGRTLGVVGESGSGKTTLARMIVGVEHPDAGTLEWRTGDGKAPRVGLVHQNPLGAFDPRWSVGRSLREALEAGGALRRERRARVAALMAEVGLESALLRRRPRELSGGQRQRAAIARALAADPEVLVLDEPVSALDATVRARILELLRRLQDERELTMVFVSHDLDVVAAVADDVLVMKDGEIVEQGPVAEVFGRPTHPFTKELLAARMQ